LKSKFLSVILTVAVTLGLLLVPAVTPVLTTSVALASSNVTIAVVPSTTTVVPSATFNVEVVIDNPDGVNIYGCQARLDFDETYFTVTGIANGDLSELVQSVYDNVNGTIDHDCNMPTPPGTPTSATSIVVCNISFQALALEGTSTIDFVYQTGAPFRQTMVTLGATDYLEAGNMGLMGDGTVIVGTPSLTINILPQTALPSPPYPPNTTMALGGCGIGYDIVWDMGIPVSYNFTVILPTDPLPNTTKWDWNELIIVAAADVVPGWGFINYTPVIGTLLPGNHYMDYGGENITIYPMVAAMSYLTMGTTCNFGPKAPEIFVAPDSLSFETFEGTNPAPDGLFLVNSGGGTLAWSAATDAGWLSVLPTSGNLTTSITVDNQTLVVSVNVTGLSAGTYSGNVTVSGASNVTVPVGLVVKPATAVDSCRDIIGSTDSGKPGETTELYAGETFDVYVNFTAPPTNPNDGFNSIGVTDTAPDGWTVTVNKNWCWINGAPSSALKVNAIGNKAEIMLGGPYNEGTTISVMYQVTVPTTATPGINTWEMCPDKTVSWLEYYFNEEGPYTHCISCDNEVVVTQPGDIVGETREVNSAELPDVDVRLLLVGPGYLRSDISTPLYVNTAWVTGTYWLTGNLTRFYELDISDGVMLPGADFTIGLTTQALLSAGYTFDFEGDYGLIPRACTMSYVLKCVNLWKIGSSANPEWDLSEWKAMDTANSWLYPS